MRLATASLLGLAALACSARTSVRQAEAPREPFTFVSRLGDHQHSFVGNAVALDAAGNALVAGATDGVAPGQRSLGGWDALVVKFAPGGALQWVRQLGTDGDDAARCVAVAPDGDALVGGSLGESPFAARLDPSGNVRWLKRLADAGPGADAIAAIAVDGRGEVTTSLGSTVLHLDERGETLWTAPFFGGEVAASCVAVDEAGNAAVAGGRPFYSSDGREHGAALAVARLGAGGATLWRLEVDESELRGGAFVEPRAIVVDAVSGDLVVAGRSVATREPGAPRSGFVARFSPEGQLRWVMQLPQADLPVDALAVGERGNIHVAGELGSRGLYVAAFDAAGTFGSMLEYATQLHNEARGIAVGREGVYVTGSMDARAEGGARPRGGVLALIKL